MPSCAVSAHGPHFYAPHLNLYFISLVEMVYAALTAHHLFAPSPPQAAVLGRLREVPEHHQRPCRQSKTDPTQLLNCVSVRYWSLCSHDVPLYFAFISWYYTLL